MKIGNFPFGQPIMPVIQLEQSPKQVFVLGVYASAVHARWIGEDNRTKISALAIASEPEIFWRGSNESAQEIISQIILPSGAGRLVPASERLNGPSGTALDERFLTPLGITRDDAWLCDLVPYSCMNEKQSAALKWEYDFVKKSLKLPDYNWPLLPRELTSNERRAEIEKELIQSGAKILITLGDQPLKWFTQFYGTFDKLKLYGENEECYGQPHSITINGKELQHIPLVHPRQAARLGAHSKKWAGLHDSWSKNSPVRLKPKPILADMNS